MNTLREKILETIVRKSTLKQQIFDNTFSTFNDLKETLFEMASEIDDELDGKLDRRVRIEYRDRGKFEAQLQVASDILLFQMHTDIFEFDSNHIIWQNSYIQEDKANSYIGVINIYNFLSDSLKYNRNADEGYLIGRIFINREKCFWVEGKRQTLVRPMAFGSRKIDHEALVSIIETAINYSLNFGLEYKGIGFNATFQGSGNQIKNLRYVDGVWGALSDNRNMSQEYYNNCYDTAGANALYPRLSTENVANNAQESTLWYRNVSWFKMRDCELYYRFPAALLQHAKITDAKVFVKGQNLLSFDNIPAMDAENLNTGYPVMKAVTFGLSVVF